VFVAQDCLGDARRDHTNPKLACTGSFDNRDIREADILLQASAKLVQGLTTLVEQLRYLFAPDACLRAQENLGGAMLSDDQRLDIGELEPIQQLRF
jgi:hypothetical protein